MLGPLTLFLIAAVGAADPRPVLVELQLEGRHREALARVDREIQTQPEASRRIGLDYLRGHLFEEVGDSASAGEAFAAVIAATPELAAYSRYRLAREQERMNHPEVAAGLIATVVSQVPTSSPLLPEALRLFSRTLEEGGDCRLLRGLRPDEMGATQRRLIVLNQADCALRADLREMGRGLLLTLLQEDLRDEAARGAAERLAGISAENEGGKLPLLLGLAFHQHREWERALQHLRRALGRNGLSDREVYDARYALGRSQFWQERYTQAVITFNELVARARTPEQQARALYQRGRAYELLGQWPSAAASYRMAYRAEPEGQEWAAASLFAALRLEWRSGQEPRAEELYRLLASRREWKDTAARASLFLAASDLVRQRADRAGAWLDQAALGEETRIEVAYWRGRREELQGDRDGAITAYLDALRVDPYHPLAQAARRRLAGPALARRASAEAQKRIVAGGTDNLLSAWLLLGEGDAIGRNVGRKLRQSLLADPGAGPFLKLNVVPVERWPLWNATLRRPEEMLLALGIWREGGPAVRQHFPAKNPSLSFTGSLLLARSGELARAMTLGEELRIRTPNRVPLALQPREYREILYPFAYRDLLTAQGRLRGVDPHLMASLIRAESRFDPLALSPAAARGLTQLTVPTARDIARQTGMGRLDPEDLYRPEIAIALGTAHMSELLRELGGLPQVAVAAYNAGTPQARLWQSYCYSIEPEELFTKVSFQETRRYLQRVLTSWAHYEELYQAPTS
ncbi:MAG TPA: transglycosylase SLT domain-containing protein [Thermoanaerobaculia bacterium]|nr:transglycosylase SLT domain-containing protein [Thermoanaerobaculia bacterium]